MKEAMRLEQEIEIEKKLRIKIEKECEELRSLMNTKLSTTNNEINNNDENNEKQIQCKLEHNEINDYYGLKMNSSSSTSSPSAIPCTMPLLESSANTENTENIETSMQINNHVPYNNNNNNAVLISYVSNLSLWTNICVAYLKCFCCLQIYATGCIVNI